VDQFESELNATLDNLVYNLRALLDTHRPQGWIYLAVVIDLYSRRIIGWNMDKHMTTALATRALTMAINLRSPAPGLVHHSDRGVQYASKEYRNLLQKNRMICSMSRKGNCWDNAPTERFFGSLKREWVTGSIGHPLCLHSKDYKTIGHPQSLDYRTKTIENYRTPT
jgi:transposase InsO family protein